MSTSPRDYFFVIRSSFEYLSDYQTGKPVRSNVWALGEDDSASTAPDARMNHPAQIKAAVEAIESSVSGASLEYIQKDYRNCGVVGIVRFEPKNWRDTAGTFFDAIRNHVRKLNLIPLSKVAENNLTPSDLQPDRMLAIWFHESLSNVLEGSDPDYGRLLLNSSHNQYEIKGLKGGVGGMRG